MNTFGRGNRHIVVQIIVTVILFIKLGQCEVIHKECRVEKYTTLTCNYIPKALPRHYDHVRILDFKRKNKNLVINNSSFTGKGWAEVQSIEFKDASDRTASLTFSRMCFVGLKSLKILRIHVASFELDDYAFVGLHLVHTLDVSNCIRLSIDGLSSALKLKETLPRLKNLIMSEIGNFRVNRNILSSDNAENLFKQGNFTKIDISNTVIPSIDLSAMSQFIKTLGYLNLSYSTITEMWSAHIDKNNLRNLKEIDMTHLHFPRSAIPPIGRLTVANQIYNYSDMLYKNNLDNLFTPLIINISMILFARVSAVRIYNSTITLDEPLDWSVKQLVGRRNNLKYLDAQVLCPHHKVTSILHLDLSDNGMEMLHPITCLPNLEIVYLSKNNLFNMQENNLSLFEQLFASVIYLRVIDLSNNRLSKVPKQMFKNNRNIENIDISFNKLEQIDFDLKDLNHLRVLDVRDNMIKILDGVSINSLSGIPCVDGSCSVLMASNPFLCSSCSSKSSIQWLLSSTLVNTEQQALICNAEGENLLPVDESIPRIIEKICHRKMITIVSSVSLIVLLLAVCIISVLFYRRLKRLKQKRYMDTVIRRLIKGEGRYEFVAFLSYSSRDDQFVQDNVIGPLNENLKLMTGTDRNLICTGDRHLRPGFMVLDEIDLCLDRASVVIVVVSDDFCRSSYCQNEFDQAYLQRKPIVLMLLGHVNEELMMPSLKRLYKRNVRILWKVENGEFVLTTSWENVCYSVLEKIVI